MWETRDEGERVLDSMGQRTERGQCRTKYLLSVRRSPPFLLCPNLAARRRRRDRWC